MNSLTTLIRQILISVIWLGFTLYIVWLAPLDQPETFPIVQHLLTLHWSEVNGYLVAIFWLMGVLPMIYGCLMFTDGRMQKLPAFVYFLASNFTGIVGLAPYLVLRDRNISFRGSLDRWLRSFESRSMGIVLSLITIFLIAYALIQGNWHDFVQEWRTIPFVHLITLDFCFMNLFLPLSPLLDDDLARRGLQNSYWFWTIALLPLFGALAYLCCRPTLQDSQLHLALTPNYQ